MRQTFFAGCKITNHVRQNLQLMRDAKMYLLTAVKRSPLYFGGRLVVGKPEITMDIDDPDCVYLLTIRFWQEEVHIVTGI